MAKRGGKGKKIITAGQYKGKEEQLFTFHRSENSCSQYGNQ